MSQLESVRQHLISKGSITPLEALRLYGCYRLSGRIKDLRDMGVNISTELIPYNGKRFAKYIYLGTNHDNTCT